MNRDFHHLLEEFSVFLARNWEFVGSVGSSLTLLDREEFVADWLQANWELIVETRFRDLTKDAAAFLEPYGSGAECNEASSRVWMPNALPTHRVVCKPRAGSELVDVLTDDQFGGDISVVFDQFVSRSPTGWYSTAPPFDHVLGYVEEREVLVRLADSLLVAEAVPRGQP